MRRRRRLALAAVAVLCAFTIAAGITVTRLLPGRLALWRTPVISSVRLAGDGRVLGPASGSADAAVAATSAGVATAVSGEVSSPLLGSQLGVLVTDLATGQVLYSRNATSGFAPASTNKLATSVAALQVLGPSARFRTTVVSGSSASQIVLVGGGDPTLAAGKPPASDYPQPATLQGLARQTAAALRARGRRSVTLGYDTSLYTGPGLAPGWPESYVTTGNVSVITPLEADQGRITSTGAPADNEASNGPRSSDPAALAAASFARFLTADGIRVRGDSGARDSAWRSGDAGERVLTAAVGNRGVDARGEQQRHRREPGAPGGDRLPPARVLQRRGSRRHLGPARSRGDRRAQPGGWQRPVSARPHLAGCPGAADHHGGKQVPPSLHAHRPAGRGLLRNSYAGRQRLRSRSSGPASGSSGRRPAI